MKILSIETSNKICSVAILEDKNLIKKIELNNGLTHSETLMPLIKQILEETKLSLSNIDLLVCDIGPGSFTGIRIGIATVKAFTDSLNIPSVGISSLEGLAYNIKNEGLICSLIDCKNNNCYYSLYELKNNTYTLLEEPKADSVENCLNYLNYKYSNSVITFNGDVSLYKELIENTSKNFILLESTNTQFNNVKINSNNIDVYNLGIAGFNKFNKNGKDENLLPLYLKKPQAQRQLEEKSISIETMQTSDLDHLDISKFDDFWNIDILKDELKSRNSEFVCAKIENKVVGFAGIKIVLDTADIMNIAVKEDYRRQGIATLLLNNIFDICNEKNIKTINLEVNEENFSAIRLYQKFGFKENGRRKKYYDNKFDAILMGRVKMDKKWSKGTGQYSLKL